MKVSILDPEFVGPDKKGIPVYISKISTCKDLEDFGLLLCEQHICVGIFAEFYRSGVNWRGCDFIGIDFDDGKTHAITIHSQLKKENINHIILASKNHMRDKNDGRGIIERFHVFIPFDERLKDPSLYSSLSTNLCRLFNWQVDKATSKDKCRYFYKHREILYLFEDGNPLALEPFIKLQNNLDRLQRIEDDRRKKFQEKLLQLQGQNRKSPVERFMRTKYYRMLTQGDLSADGNRYANSNSIIGGMIQCDLSLSEAMALFDKFSTYGEGFTRDSVIDRYNKWS